MQRSIVCRPMDYLLGKKLSDSDNSSFPIDMLGEKCLFWLPYGPWHMENFWNFSYDWNISLVLNCFGPCTFFFLFDLVPAQFCVKVLHVLSENVWISPSPLVIINIFNTWCDVLSILEYSIFWLAASLRQIPCKKTMDRFELLRRFGFLFLFLFWTHSDLSIVKFFLYVKCHIVFDIASNRKEVTN